ncbi:CBS domain-containing protein [Nocardioides sp. BE266]|uniref:CBS domain-containing protein n=1 Tax=Nocardioides sp. BE266 TaxID=2817725 RepID=UPI00285D63B8|nr:CBS domain-containing protein [Nocardioides sp. BE266]MDR7255464.1 CBS domain-containing protein [Nocardioides sp. BE266]
MTSLVAEVMLRSPIVLDRSATVDEVRTVFAGTHVHMVLLTPTGRVGEPLLGTLVRDDLAAPEMARGPVLPHARLAGRTVGADLLADDVRRSMQAAGKRRAAVVDAGGLLLGLLCLKHHGGGFCTDAGVASRRAARRSDQSEAVSRPPGT